jgi:hypothetical protein
VALDLFRNHYVRHLRLHVGANLARYSNPRPWAGRPTGAEPVTLATTLEPCVPLALEMPDGEDLKDIENSKIVYEAFPNLTPLQARDPRLWTRLTHVECWSYMRKRWDVNRFSADAGRAERFVLTRYFVPQAQSRALLRNGLARLWWYAHLTYDATREDPYELTAELLSFLDIAQQVLERNMGRAPQIRIGFLDFLRQNRDRLGASAEQRRRRIRDLAKALNLRGGVMILDSLSITEVEEILEEELTADASG